MIDEAEKARLLCIMQQSSDSILSHVSQDAPRTRKLQQSGSSADELHQLFDSVTQEIEERRAFLGSAVQSIGHRQVARISREIAERIDELKKLDDMLREFN